MSCLLRIEVNPHRITALWDVLGRSHHTSPPVAGPVSISPCKLCSVTWAKRSSNFKLDGLTSSMTNSLPRSDNSTGELSSRPIWLASGLGMRRAKLLPHFCTRVSISLPPIDSRYNEDTLRIGIYQDRFSALMLGDESTGFGNPAIFHHSCTCCGKRICLAEYS